MRRQLLLAAVAALLSCLSPVGPASAFTEKELDAIFRMLDANGDGKVTREEYSQNIVAVIYRNVSDYYGAPTGRWTPLKSWKRCRSMPSTRAKRAI